MHTLLSNRYNCAELRQNHALQSSNLESKKGTLVLYLRTPPRDASNYLWIWWQLLFFHSPLPSPLRTRVVGCFLTQNSEFIFYPYAAVLVQNLGPPKGWEQLLLLLCPQTLFSPLLCFPTAKPPAFLFSPHSQDSSPVHSIVDSLCLFLCHSQKSTLLFLALFS